MPRMTARNALDRKPPAGEHAEAADRLVCVIRATRIKPAARADERTDGPLIQPDQELCHEPHFVLTSCHKGSSWARSMLLAAPRTRIRALTTRSSAGISC